MNTNLCNTHNLLRTYLLCYSIAFKVSSENMFVYEFATQIDRSDKYKKHNYSLD